MNRSTERGFTLVEIMIVVAIIALLAAIAIPNVLRGRTTANESAAIGNLRALVSSQEMYRSVNNKYTKDTSWVANMFPVGGVPAFAPPSFNIAMTGQTVQGYNYTYLALPAACTDAANNCTQYGLQAVPQVLNQTGTRSVFTSDAGTVRHCTGSAAALTAATVTTWATKATIDQAPTATCL